MGNHREGSTGFSIQIMGFSVFPENARKPLHEADLLLQQPYALMAVIAIDEARQRPCRAPEAAPVSQPGAYSFEKPGCQPDRLSSCGVAGRSDHEFQIVKLLNAATQRLLFGRLADWIGPAESAAVAVTGEAAAAFGPPMQAKH